MTPTNDDFDDMHHAIGRKGIKDAFRNYYCTPVGSNKAERFQALGLWDLRSTINDGRDAIYSVNMRGIEVLRDWIANRSLHPSTVFPPGGRPDPDCPPEGYSASEHTSPEQ